MYWDVDPVLFSLFGFGVRWYSLCWAAGLVASYLIAKRSLSKAGVTNEKILDLFVYVVVGTLVGARLGHCLFYDWVYFSHHPLEIILPVSISSQGIVFTGYSGLASHGGAIGIVLSLVIFNRKYKIPLLQLLDTLAYVAPLAGAFIRVGNFFNSEIIGAPSNSALAVTFARVDNIPRHPAQLYEAVAYIFIFLLLVVLVKYFKSQKDGQIFGLSLILIFVARFLIEYCKEVQEPFEIVMRETVGVDMGQILSVPFILLGIFFFFRGFKRKMV